MQQILDLPRIDIIVQVVVDVQFYVLRKNLARSLEGLPGIVAGHQSVVALADRVARNHRSSAEVRRALVAYILSLIHI